MNKYVCCFCDETINKKVTALLAVTNWSDLDDTDQESQQLFCHLQCLKKALKKQEYLYIEEN